MVLKIPDEVLKQLARDEDAPMTPREIEILFELAKDADWKVRAGLACREDIPTEILTEILPELAEDEDKRVRERVAEHGKASKEVLIKLAEDDDVCVQEKVAGNQETPKEVLIKLANHSFENVRASVAGNPEAPVEAFALLVNALFYDDEVRRNLLANPNIPPEDVDQFINDLRNGRDDEVRKSVLEDPNTPEAIRARVQPLR